jgi:hypothetical protein
MVESGIALDSPQRTYTFSFEGIFLFLGGFTQALDYYKDVSQTVEGREHSLIFITSLRFDFTTAYGWGRLGLSFVWSIVILPLVSEKKRLSLRFLPAKEFFSQFNHYHIRLSEILALA